MVISEVAVAPAAGESVELYNPTSAAVDLSSYYLSDNSVYYGIATGVGPVDEQPRHRLPGPVPRGHHARARGGPRDRDLSGLRGDLCPDFILSATPPACASGTAKAMVAPVNGGLGDKAGTLLSNDREMVVLFSWDGTAATVKDVDYVTWGTTYEDGTRADKTGVAGCQDDTPAASQTPAPSPTQCIQRCILEQGEEATGGNGLNGHDETSEPLNTTFTQGVPSPGVKSACL